MIYIASPYTHEVPAIVEARFQQVTKYAAGLVKQGKTAISPITYGHTLLGFEDMPTDWLFWRSFCLQILLRCTEVHVLMLPGWDESRGIAAELEIAMLASIPIVYIDPVTHQPATDFAHV